MYHKPCCTLKIPLNTIPSARHLLKLGPLCFSTRGVFSGIHTASADGFILPIPPLVFQTDRVHPGSETDWLPEKEAKRVLNGRVGFSYILWG